MARIAYDKEFREQVRQRVGAFERRAIVDAELVRAAVAVTIVGDDNGDAAFILTRRPLTLRRHAGQWALPGGRTDDNESANEAALRELDEEVGLHLDAVDDFETRSGFVITPVVIWGPQQPALELDPTEVHAAHLVAGSKYSCGIPVVEFQQPTEPFATANRSVCHVRLLLRRKQQQIVPALMIPLMVMMFDMLLQRVTKRPLPEQ